MLLLLDDDGSSSSFLGYVASNKLPHLISIGLRIKYVSFSYRWPLVKLRKQTRGSWNDRCTVSLFTFDGNNKIGLLQFSLEPWEKKRSVPVFPPIFLLRTLQQRNGRIFLVEGVIAIYRFFLLPSLSTSISRILGAKRINADRDSRQLASGQAGYYKCMYHCLSVLFSKPIQQTALFA